MNKFPCERRILIRRGKRNADTAVIELCCTFHGKIGETSKTDWGLFNDETVQREASRFLEELWSDHVADANLRENPIRESLPVHLL